jgi:cytochrome P450
MTQRSVSSIEQLALPPGTLGLPLIGETFNFLLSIIAKSDFPTKKFQKYGNIYKTRLFGQLVVFVNEPSFYSYILTNENRYVQHLSLPTTTTMLGESSLICQTGDTHINRRQTLYKAFQVRNLSNYIPVVENITLNYLQRWEKIRNFGWKNEIEDYTFDLACKFLIGLDNASQTQFKTLYKGLETGIFAYPFYLPGTKILFPGTTFAKGVNSRKKTLVYLEKYIAQRRQQKNCENDALDILLKARDDKGNPLSLKELQEQIVGLLFGASGALVSALTSFCLLAKQNQNVLNRLRCEQQQFDWSEPLTPEMLKQMTYLEKVLKEVMRMFAPVNAIFRKAIQDFELGNYRIPKDAKIVLFLPYNHHNPKNYQNSSIFDPERFNAQAIDERPKFSYTPFGGGLRECIGKDLARLEMKVFAAMLVRNYDWDLVAEQDLNINFFPMPFPNSGLKVVFRKIN